MILQRQFFEALVRAAAVKYANNSELPSLSDKVEYLFKQKLAPLATKNKAKSSDDDKNFKLAETVFQQFEVQLRTVFRYFSKKNQQQDKKKGSAAIFGLKEDVTLDVTEVINIFEKSNILDHKKLETHQLIEVIEKYYTPGFCLKDKLTQDKFRVYARANPLLLPVNMEIDARKKRI